MWSHHNVHCGNISPTRIIPFFRTLLLYEYTVMCFYHREKMAESLFHPLFSWRQNSKHLLQSGADSPVSLPSLSWLNFRLVLLSAMAYTPCCKWVPLDAFIAAHRGDNEHSHHVQMRMTPCWEKLPYTSVWKCVFFFVWMYSLYLLRSWTSQMVTMRQQEKENQIDLSRC